MRPASTFVIVAAILAGAPVLANDTTAKLSAGGLVLTRTDRISMLSEDLYISPTAVRVRYRFLNRSGRDVTTRVAFPMPDIGGPNFFEGDVAIPVDDPANFLGFVTVADGRSVRAEVEQKALVGGVDRTSWLHANGVPLALHRQEARDALQRLSAGKRAEASRLGLVDEDLNPAWVLKTIFHWVQTFPAGRPIAIEHRYRPSVGSTAGTQLGSGDDGGTAARYCVEPGLLATLRRSAQSNDGMPSYSEKWIDYILVTGGNWKDPIGDFRLVVDKGSPRNLVSFCGAGVRKIGPTRFELRRRNWRPERDLSILILTPY
jgi:hypothetical protein